MSEDHEDKDQTTNEECEDEQGLDMNAECEDEQGLARMNEGTSC
jgi:hypothetical protein